MTYLGKIDYHKPTDDGEICVYDHELWPCIVQQVRAQCAELIRTDETVPAMRVLSHPMIHRDLLADRVEGV